MTKKIFILALILLIFFSGCTKKTEESENQKIDLKEYSADFEKNTIEFTVFSEKENPKVLFEIFNSEKKLKCFKYFNLKKGKNLLLINCQEITSKNLFVSVTPSKTETEEFEIKLNPKPKLELKKGFKYTFIQKAPEYNLVFDYEVFVIDKNEELIKVLSKTAINEKDTFDLLLIDNNYFIYSSGLKDTCEEAFSSELTRKFNDDESNIIYPFIFFYYQNNGSFLLNEFIEKRNYEKYFPKIKKTVKLTLIQETLLKGRETYEINFKVSETPAFLANIQSKDPKILLYYKTAHTEFEFKKEIKEEFDEEKYGCLRTNLVVE